MKEITRILIAEDDEPDEHSEPAYVSEGQREYLAANSDDDDD